MKTIILSLLLAGLLAVHAQYAVSSVHNDCGGQCQTNTTCCGSDSYCAGNAIEQRCCPNGSGFCGCISNRGYCNGNVYNSTKVSGSDTFGACYDQTAASCTYNPSSNNWIVCPNAYTPCKSSSFYTCCSPDTVCTTTDIDSYPICAAKSTTAASTPATTQSQTQSDASTSNSDSGLAVASQNPTCQSNCPSSNDTCCDCCTDGSYCAGNLESKRCCPANSGFCGCISDRAFCQGSVYNSSRVSGYDSFGACFDASSGATCTYNPNPNLWIVCPKDYTACESSSFFSCCDSNSVCTTTSLDSYPICAPKNSSATSGRTSDNAVVTSSSAAEPSATASSHPQHGTFLAPTPDEFSTLTAGQQYTFSYMSPTNPTGNVVIVFLGPATLYTGSFRSNPLVVTATVPQSLSGVVNLTFIEEYNQYGPFGSYNIATSRQYTVVAAASTGASTSNCPAPLQSCGDACYSESEYCCPNGVLTQKAFCGSAATSSGNAPASSSNVAATASAGGQPTQNNGNCPPTLSSCGEACYSPEMYCCPNGVLTQKAFCGSNTATANAGPSTGSSANSQPTQASTSNCPSTLRQCGEACYTPDMYCCPNGALVQKAFCPAGAV